MNAKHLAGLALQGVGAYCVVATLLRLLSLAWDGLAVLIRLSDATSWRDSDWAIPAMLIAGAALIRYGPLLAAQFIEPEFYDGSVVRRTTLSGIHTALVLLAIYLLFIAAPTGAIETVATFFSTPRPDSTFLLLAWRLVPHLVLVAFGGGLLLYPRQIALRLEGLIKRKTRALVYG